jgi:hypothetical protein
MRFKLPAVSIAFFKVAAGNPIMIVPLPTSAGNGVPSAKTVPGADTKICHHQTQRLKNIRTQLELAYINSEPELSRTSKLQMPPCATVCRES